MFNFSSSRTLVFVVCSIAKIFPYLVLYVLLVRSVTFTGYSSHQTIKSKKTDIYSQMSTLPLAVASKLTQVMELYRIKTQGGVSKLTWSLAAYGCAGEKH